MSMLKAMFFDVKSSELPYLEKFLSGKVDYKVADFPLNIGVEVTEDMAEVEILSVFTTSRVTKEVLEKFKNLKLIALRSVGFSHIDIDYCKENGIIVSNTPHYGDNTVAEFTFGLLIEVARKIQKAKEELKAGKVDEVALTGIELSGKTIGIIGLGAIGFEVARIAKGFNMKILAYDIVHNPAAKIRYDVQYVELDDLLKHSDIISVHSPLTKENYHLLNEAKFEIMKDGVIIINTSRGETIDTQALYNALVSKKVMGAGLDVVECEDILQEQEKFILNIDYIDKENLKRTLINNKLMSLENVIITPHIAYDTKEAINRIQTIACSNILSFLKSEINNCVYSL